MTQNHASRALILGGGGTSEMAKEPFFLFHFPFSSDPCDSFTKISERCAKKCLKKVAFLAHSEPPRPDQELSLHQSAIA